MRRLGHTSIIALAAIALPLGAQEPPTVFRADARLVVLHVTVVDRHGKLITDLPRSAFRVYEDGVEQPLKTAHREDVPVSMGILIDNSGSMKEKRKKVEAAAVALVKASNPQDEVFIINFNDNASLDVDFTSEIKKLDEGVARIDSRGGTAMRDAIETAMDHLSKKGMRDKKVVVVVTDGEDNQSAVTLKALVRKTQQQRELLIYTIGLLAEDPRRSRRPRLALDMIAKATGGEAYYPRQVDDVGEFTLTIARDIRSQYTLTYRPIRQNLDGSFRKIKVVADSWDRIDVRTRTGYYATPDATRTGQIQPSQDADAAGRRQRGRHKSAP